ncbi:MAG: hypothetical protein KGM93_13215 [Sphingomonadales bacterium]|nr:hypothetical protein [Sphingomonadales bacterium]
MNRSDQLRELSGLKGSTGIGLIAFLGMTAFGSYRGLALPVAALGSGLVYAVLTVAIVQALARLAGPARDRVVLALASVALFAIMTGPETFASGAGVDWFIVLAIWGGVSLAALVLLTVYRRN